MSTVADKLVEGLSNAAMMAWEVWWALVLGFAISAIVQAWIPRERVERALAGRGAGAVGKATALGAASSSCSYAAIAIARSLFAKGASAATALAFQFASTNLVWEIGLVLWVLLGWQFTLAEYLGGILMIILMAAMLRLFVSPKLEEIARRNAENAAPGHQHHMAGSEMSLSERIRSADAWSDVAHNFRGDWQMLWKEIVIGFLLAGYIALLGQDFFNGLFLVGETGFWPTLWNVIVGPLIAVASFVCSIGNIPLAAVLWSGGISFAGVLAFIFADLIVFPIIIAYRKYYGWSFALRITALMFVTMVIAALAIDGLFSLADIIPTDRPSTEEVFGHIEADYRMWLNGIALIVFAILIALTVRRGATDPVCGMKVDKSKGVAVRTDSGTVYFCSEHCH
ncbi:MAG: permease, partial [bacterium]